MSAASRVRRAAIMAAAAVSVSFALVGGVVSSAARADDGDSDGTKLVVTVIGPSASPTGTATSTATSTATGDSGSSSSATAPTPDEPSTTPTGTPPDRGDLGGLLYVSGLGWAYHPSVNPFGGSLELWFSVRNAYTEPVDATARFWVTHLFGGTVGIPAEVPVSALQPGETRTVRATVDGLAQWGLVVGHLTFAPPATLGEASLVPVNREVLAWFFSWPFLCGAGVTGVAFAWWFLFARRGLRLRAMFGVRQ